MATPKIRLKGFEGGWKECTLNDTIVVNSGRDYKHLNKGDIPVYGTGGFMTSVNKSLSNEDAIGVGRKGTIDKPQYLKAPFWTVDTLFFLTSKKGDVLGFLFPLLQKVNWKQYDESTGVPSLSKNNIEKIIVFKPSIAEQSAIASYFESLDNLIQTTAKKIESLKQMKAASLISMFPQEGESVPKVRFKGFKGEWRKSAIKDICQKYASMFSESSLGEDTGNYPVYGAAGYLQKIPSYDFDVPYVGIIKDGSGVGRCQLYPAFSSILSTMQYILPKSDIDVTFLYSLFETVDFSIFINGSSIPHIYFKDYGEKTIMVPRFEEQKAIGNYFSSLDSQISIQSQRLEKLKNIKAECLNKMFV